MGQIREAIDDRLVDLERERTPEGPERAKRQPGRSGLFPKALEVPKLRAEYERLLRDRKVAEMTLLYSLERLEAAKATEARDVSTFQVLDAPVVSTRHRRPRLATAVVGWSLTGLLVGLAVAWRSRPREQEPTAPAPRSA